MPEYELSNFTDGYVEMVHRVLHDGKEVSPRGMRTKEITDVTIKLTDPTQAVPVGVGRGLNLKIGAAETAQLLGGVSDARQMVKASPNFSTFVERHRLWGAYGPRAYGQWERALSKLHEDSDSRQAMISIYGVYDSFVPSKDIPCTLVLMYHIRNGCLDATTVMRSNDIIWGSTYDFWMFTMAQRVMANALGISVGTYTHFAKSLHAYVDRDQKIFDRLHAYDGEPQPPAPVAFNYKSVSRNKDQLVKRWTGRVRPWMEAAVGIRSGWSDDSACKYPTKGVQWYIDTLKPTVRHDEEWFFCRACRYVLPSQYFSQRGRALCTSCLRENDYKAPEGSIEALVKIQEARCAICRNEAGLVVDHDHETGMVRGLLCETCNGGLGMLGDTVEGLDVARSYLADGCPLPVTAPNPRVQGISRMERATQTNLHNSGASTKVRTLLS